MAKGQQRSNREAKKPKKVRAPAKKTESSFGSQFKQLGARIGFGRKPKN